jgi:hypothetical protein
MKTQLIRSALVLTNFFALSLAVAAEPEPSDSGSASQPEAQLQIIQSAVFPSPANGEYADNQFVIQSGDAAQHSMQDMRQKLKDPQSRAAFRAQQRSALEGIYADIEQELGIDAATRDKLMDLLVDEQLTQLESSIEMHRDMDSSLQKRADAETQRLESLRSVLGQEGLEEFQFYVSTVGERYQVHSFDELLPAAEKLQPEQKNQLVHLFLENNRRAREEPFRPHMSRAFGPMEGMPSREEMQRQSQLLTIEANEAAWRRAQQETPLLESRASEFLSSGQLSTLQRMNQEKISDLREWIEHARAQAGLSPQIPETEQALVARASQRKPIAGDATFEFTVTVNRSEPITHTHTGQNAQPILFSASDGLWIEATPTLYEDHWLDVRLAFYEQLGEEKRRIDRGSSFGTLTRLPDGTTNRSGMSTDVITGSKGYAVTTLVSVVP